MAKDIPPKYRLKKLLYFLRPLAETPKQWKLFREYLVSPLHANNQWMAGILDLLWENIHLPGDVIEENVYGALYPDKNPKAAITTGRRNMTKLLHHFIDFKALMEYKDDKHKKIEYWMRAAHREQWDEYFESLFNRALEALEKMPKTEWYYRALMQLADLWDRYQSRMNINPSGNSERYQKELDALMNTIAIHLLKLALNKQILLSQVKDPDKPRMPLLDGIVTDMKNRPGGYGPLAKTYLALFQAISRWQEEDQFEHLKSVIFGSETQFGMLESQVLNQHLTNYLNLRYNHFRQSGKEKEATVIRKNLTELYTYQVEHKIIFSLGSPQTIDHRMFINIVKHFLGINDFDWTRQFIEDYEENVVASRREITVNYAWGLYHFEIGDEILDNGKTGFQLAKSHFNDVLNDLSDTKDPYLSLNAKVNYLRSLYECKMYQMCAREARNRKKAKGAAKYFPEGYWGRFEGFCGCVAKLCESAEMSPFHEKRETRIKEVKDRLSQEPGVLHKRWLSKKIEEQLRR